MELDNNKYIYLVYLGSTDLEFGYFFDSNSPRVAKWNIKYLYKLVFGNTLL